MREPSGLESFDPRTRVRSSPGLGSARVRSTLLAARESWRAPLLRGRLCCAPSATSHRTRENIYRCSRYTASGNKSIVFIFKWRLSDFCLVVSEEKGSVQRHPDSSGLESTRVRGCLEPAREQHYKYRTKATRKVRITNIVSSLQFAKLVGFASQPQSIETSLAIIYFPLLPVHQAGTFCFSTTAIKTLLAIIKYFTSLCPFSQFSILIEKVSRLKNAGLREISRKLVKRQCTPRWFQETDALWSNLGGSFRSRGCGKKSIPGRNYNTLSCR